MAENDYVSFSEAIHRIQSTNIQVLGTQKEFINNIVNRILSQDILAKEDSPKFDTSNMDGYAFCYDDIEILQKEGLKIDSINKAGNTKDCAVRQGFCIKTFTGSKMPQNADSLAIIEQIEVKDNKIFLKKGECVSQGKWIRKAGENYKKGQILLSKGSLISPFDIGILAQNNDILVEVYRKPKISILTSGDEIIEIGDIPQNPNYIYSSNNHLLSAVVCALSAESSLHSTIRDSKNEIKNAITTALKNSDIVAITGGMSKGDFDFTKDIIKEFGEPIFNGVKIKPGKVMSCIKCAKSFGENKYIIALPGNPASSLVSFVTFGRLILQKMFGLNPTIPIHKAILAQDIYTEDTSRLVFGMADLYLKNGVYEVVLRKNIQSYMIDNFNGAMIIIDKKEIKRGELVDIIILNDLLTISNYKEY